MTASDPSPPPATAETAHDDSSKEVGGWLILLLLILLILYPLQIAIFVVATAVEFPWSDLFTPAGTAVYWTLANLVIQTALACYALHCGMKLLKIKRAAVRHTKIFLAAVLTYSLALGVPALIAEHRGNTQLDSIISASLRNVVFALFWYAYLELSKRVATTYSQ